MRGMGRVVVVRICAEWRGEGSGPNWADISALEAFLHHAAMQEICVRCHEGVALISESYHAGLTSWQHVVMPHGSRRKRSITVVSPSA